jgi:hypothetical protein
LHLVVTCRVDAQPRGPRVRRARSRPLGPGEPGTLPSRPSPSP